MNRSQSYGAGLSGAGLSRSATFAAMPSSGASGGLSRSQTYAGLGDLGLSEPPKVITVNPAVKATSQTSLSDRFSQLYQKRRGTMVPQQQAQQTTTRFTNAMSRRTGEAPPQELQNEVFTSSYNRSMGGGPGGQVPQSSPPPQPSSAAPGGGHAPYYEPEHSPPAQAQAQGQGQQQNGRRAGGFPVMFQMRDQQGQGAPQKAEGQWEDFTSQTGTPTFSATPGPPQTQPSKPPPGPRSWHVVRGAALQPAPRPTQPPPRAGGAMVPPSNSYRGGRGGGGYGYQNGPGPGQAYGQGGQYRNGPGGRGGRGRGGRGGYGGGMGGHGGYGGGGGGGYGGNNVWGPPGPMGNGNGGGFGQGYGNGGMGGYGAGDGSYNRGGRSGQHQSRPSQSALDADLDRYMQGSAKTGTAALDADMDEWRRKAGLDGDGDAEMA